MPLQNQQQSKSHQELLICVLPKEEEQQSQQQKVPGVHVIQVELVQEMPEKTCQAVGKSAASA